MNFHGMHVHIDVHFIFNLSIKVTKPIKNITCLATNKEWKVLLMSKIQNNKYPTKSENSQKSIFIKIIGILSVLESFQLLNFTN